MSQEAGLSSTDFKTIYNRRDAYALRGFRKLALTIQPFYGYFTRPRVMSLLS